MGLRRRLCRTMGWDVRHIPSPLEVEDPIVLWLKLVPDLLLPDLLLLPLRILRDLSLLPSAFVHPNVRLPSAASRRRRHLRVLLLSEL
ncbi:hypothetical protein ACLOJK_026614 [Asimina triloba]